MILRPSQLSPPKISVDYYNVKNDGRFGREMKLITKREAAVDPLEAIYNMYYQQIKTTPGIIAKAIRFTMKLRSSKKPTPRPTIHISETTNDNAEVESPYAEGNGMHAATLAETLAGMTEEDMTHHNEETSVSEANAEAIRLLHPSIEGGRFAVQMLSEGDAEHSAFNGLPSASMSSSASSAAGGGGGGGGGKSKMENDSRPRRTRKVSRS